MHCSSTLRSTLPPQCFRQGSLDTALSVRKQALHTMADLLRAAPTDVTLQSAWLEICMPMIKDRESSVQEL